MEFIVYRFRNELRELIYVGSTNGLGARLYAHARDKDWWPEVVHIEIERCGSNETMLETERLVIETERPRYNKQYNGARSHQQVSQPRRSRPTVMKRDNTRNEFVSMLLHAGAHGVSPKQLIDTCTMSVQTTHRWLNKLAIEGCVTKVRYGRYTVTDRNISRRQMMSVLGSNGLAECDIHNDI